MSVHKYNSWGRTRRPKNLAGNDGTAVGTVKGLTSLQTSSLTPQSGAYKTENQRYLHVIPSGSSGTHQVDHVYGYNYAAASWVELKTVNPTDGTRDVISVSGNELVVVDIYGVDLISVAGTGSIYLAGSTF
tara:strand:- start:783 stop:1175 length:393 start_codon:yes stop_codon:yes gene_type:complete